MFTAAVMELMAKGAASLSAALGELARQEQYLAVEDAGRRYDLGAPHGLLIAQLALSLNGRTARRCCRIFSIYWWTGNCGAARDESMDALCRDPAGPAKCRALSTDPVPATRLWPA